MEHEFTLDLGAYVRIKDYARHGVVIDRFYSETQGEVYCVMEPNLKQFYWKTTDLTVMVGEEREIRNVPNEP